MGGAAKTGGFHQVNLMNRTGAFGRNGFVLGFLFFVFGSLCAAPADDASQLPPWRDYRVIMWVSDRAYQNPAKIPLFFQRLRELGVNTAMVHGDGNNQPLLENHFPYYVENLINRGLCLKFSSNVRDWDKFINGWGKSGR